MSHVCVGSMRATCLDACWRTQLLARVVWPLPPGPQLLTHPVRLDLADDGDVRNWLSPKHAQDHGKHAGKSEREAMEVLGFDMRLRGRDVVIGNGIDARNGFLDKAVLRQWGVSSYADLWGEHGKVAAAAQAAMGEEGGEGRVSAAARAIGESLWHRRADMRRHASKRSCGGACPVHLCSACAARARPKDNCYGCKRSSCRECETRRRHEHMERLVCETKEALDALL
jgi:hypothetical protein